MGTFRLDHIGGKIAARDGGPLNLFVEASIMDGVTRAIAIFCRRTTRRVFHLSLLASMIISLSWAQQSYSRPPSPVFPTTMAECDKLQQAYARLQQKISADHEACLQARSSPNAHSGGPEPAGKCSVPACQKLHNLLHDPLYSGTPDVAACRQKVQAKIDDDKKRQDALDAQKRHEEEDRKAADEIRKMKEYGDKEQREQGARDAAARKQAIEDEKSRQKHDAHELQKEQQMKIEHEQRTLDRQASDQKSGIDEVAQRHDAWAIREQSRRERERSIMTAYEKQIETLDEQQRVALLDKVTKELDKIHDEGKQDKEPKK
jgi:hypothetical protein